MKLFLLSTILFAAGIFEIGAATSSYTVKKIEKGNRAHIMVNMTQHPEVRQLLSNDGFIRKNKETEYIQVYLRFDPSLNQYELTRTGAIIGTVTEDIMTLQVPLDKLKEITTFPGIKVIRPARQLRPLMDIAKKETRADQVEAGIDLPLSFRGNGVVIGVIDNGFEYGHANFIDAQTQKLRIKKVWEQGAEVPSNLKEYRYGYEYTSPNAILEKKYDTQLSSHGTHVAGIAAGGDTRSGNLYSGIAGESDIVLVSCLGTETSLIDGIQYIFNYADSVGKPCVINISLGTQLGPHDGTSITDQMIDAMSKEGRIIVGAAGNSSGGTGHLSKTFSFQDKELHSALKFQAYGTTQIGQADFWGDAGKRYTARAYLYDKQTRTEIASTKTVIMGEDELTMLSYRDIPIGAKDSMLMEIGVLTEINENNSKPNAYVLAYGTGINKSRFYVGLQIQGTSGTVHGWADDYYSTFDNLGFPEYSKGDDEYSVTEVGGTANRIISVGSYTSRRTYPMLSGSTGSTSDPLGAISSFSSKGPRVDGHIKPDIAAPGALVISSYSKHYASFRATVMTGSSYYNNDYFYYGVMQGTSMSSPFVAGVVATWLEANPTLTPEDVKEILIKTARNDSYTGDIRTTGSKYWGYGKVNPWDGIRESIALATSLESASTTTKPYRPITVENGMALLFTRPLTNVCITVYDPSGRTIGQYHYPTLNAAQEIQITIGEGVGLISIISSECVHMEKVYGIR